MHSRLLRSFLLLRYALFLGACQAHAPSFGAGAELEKQTESAAAPFLTCNGPGNNSLRLTWTPELMMLPQEYGGEPVLSFQLKGTVSCDSSLPFVTWEDANSATAHCENFNFDLALPATGHLVNRSSEIELIAYNGFSSAMQSSSLSDPASNGRANLFVRKIQYFRSSEPRSLYGNITGDYAQGALIQLENAREGGTNVTRTLYGLGPFENCEQRILGEAFQERICVDPGSFPIESKYQQYAETIREDLRLACTELGKHPVQVKPARVAFGTN